MNSLLNNKIKKIEYFFFIKKVQQKIIYKKQIKTKIILFQKRFGIEQLLINVINEMKNNLLKEKLKHFLVKKFIYTVMEQYIENYNKENNTYLYDTYNNDKKKKINNSKKLFSNYLIKSNIYTFLNGANICINNSRLRFIQYNYANEIRINKIKIYFKKIIDIRKYSFINEKKKIMCKYFFINIKSRINYNKTKINGKNELKNKQKNFIKKKIFGQFINNCRIHLKHKKRINDIRKKYVENENIGKIRNKIIKKYFIFFIQRIKIIKNTNYSLKRRIFNLIKNNAKISKDLKYYLNEATKIK